MRRRAARVTVAAVAAACLAVSPLACRSVVAATAPPLWPTYHGDPARTGVDSNDAPFAQIGMAWTSAQLDGAVYAQPVVDGNTVVVVTENDTVYALDGVTGHVQWSTSVGTPATHSGAGLPCGDIDPLGITGTPVIDHAAAVVYVAAERVDASQTVSHALVGLQLGSGHMVLNRVIDPPGMDAKVQQERGALALANGHVYVPFGGLDGDCGDYHGWVVGLQTDGGGSLLSYEVSPGKGKGGIWGTSGPAVDAAGNLLVATGNSDATSSTDAYDDSDGVIKLSPTLQVVDRFAPAQWYSDNAQDQDLGSAGPTLLGSDRVFEMGKTGTGYLLNANALGGIGGALFSAHVCAAFGGFAYAPPFVYTPCTDGVRALRVASGGGSFSVAWHGPSGANGPPVVAGGSVWVCDWNNGVIYALDPATGGTKYSATLGGMEHFTSPTAAGGRILVGVGRRIVALSGGNPYVPGPPPTQGYRLVASDGGVFAFGTSGFFGSTGGVHLASPVVGAAATHDDRGYWMTAADGGVFAFGDAGFFGSMGGMRLAAPMVGMAPAPDGHGYWLVASDGGVFTFGDSQFFGSTGAMRLNAPVVGMAATPSGHGYWLVASDGGIFAFGDAGFLGSTGGMRLNAPVVGMAMTSSGRGYWSVAADGGVFAFGDAEFLGSTGALTLQAPVVAMARSGSGHGYRMAARDGGVFSFGDANFYGGEAGFPLVAPVVGMTVSS